MPRHRHRVEIHVRQVLLQYGAHHPETMPIQLQLLKDSVIEIVQPEIFREAADLFQCAHPQCGAGIIGGKRGRRHAGYVFVHRKVPVGELLAHLEEEWSIGRVETLACPQLGDDGADLGLRCDRLGGNEKLVQVLRGESCVLIEQQQPGAALCSRTRERCVVCARQPGIFCVVNIARFKRRGDGQLVRPGRVVVNDQRNALRWHPVFRPTLRAGMRGPRSRRETGHREPPLR